ncbi:hypothetical protein BDN72DRAFT_62871 [Pluteus cervinus]|uniref:Uncharacterized protein n=1 Tax=Pluteus cervinus TaxID=181527 RepID=A0ACD3AS28_9AGAR|nr:hypothetical protein BDN72DRAFT_62871 [Pluteus cervinus]
MDTLTDYQRGCVTQLRDLTAGGDDDVSIDVLRSVNWDVQRAADLIFSSSGPPKSGAFERFEVDDGPAPPSHRHQRHRTWAMIPRPLWNVIVFPLQLLSNICRFIFNVLRIPLPYLRFLPFNSYRPLRPQPRPSTRNGKERWIRELEEETGATCISRSRNNHSQSLATGTEPGPSSATLRTTTSQFADGSRRVLPDFALGTYEETLRLVQREAKIGCVVLLSEEHDDVAEFKRSTLTNSNFVQYLYRNNIIVWGGDTRDADAWNASEKLQATTYPFVAFVALQPRRVGSGSASNRSQAPPVLTVLSRHQGPSIPAGGPTSAQTLLDHLERQVMPRVTPFLERIRQQQRERERDRQLREEQDRAFQDAARRDKERIEARIAEEREEREARVRADEEARAEKERLVQQRNGVLRREAQRMEWRLWARRALVAPEALDNRGAIRMAVRFPNGARVMRRFSPDTTLTGLYAFVDVQLIPSNLLPKDDPVNPPTGQVVTEAAIENQISSWGNTDSWWGFKLVLAYPRKEISWQSGVRLAQIDGLQEGGQLVVELLGKVQTQSTENHEDEEDGYDTEDSE